MSDKKITVLEAIVFALSSAEGMLSVEQIIAGAPIPLTKVQVAPTLSGAFRKGLISREKAPEGSGQGVRWVYGPPSGDAPHAPAAAPRARRAKAKKKVKPDRKLKGFRAEAREKGRRRKHHTSRGPKKALPLSPLPPPLLPELPIWALTSEGEFILLGAEIKIPRPAARALVAFVDRLKEGAA